MNPKLCRKIIIIDYNNSPGGIRFISNFDKNMRNKQIPFCGGCCSLDIAIFFNLFVELQTMILELNPSQGLF